MNDFGATQTSVGQWTVHAPAKINLWLKIHGKRPDGYHDLSTVILALDLCDRLSGRCTSSDAIELHVAGPHASGDIPADERNLVWKALNALRELVSRESQRPAPGLDVLLHKEIPSQAGMGGGSSDAAAALALGERLLEMRAPDDWKREQMARLGADCSFFQEVGSSGLALCEGIGEIVRPWDGAVPAWHVVYLVPEVVCPTGAVFACLSGTPSGIAGPPFESLAHLQGLELASVRTYLATDLERAVLVAVPELTAWRALLDDAGLEHFRLSGSGSAFFGLYEDASSAAACRRELLARVDGEGLKLRAIGVARPAGR